MQKGLYPPSRSSVGMVTGFFLRHLDSVLKSVASALEVVLTMLAAYAIFGTPLDTLSVLAASLVGLGVALYARPVQHKPQGSYALVGSTEPEHDTDQKE